MLELMTAYWLLTHDHTVLNHEWYEFQRNQRGSPCCSNNDWTEPSDWRRTPEGFQVLWRDVWMDVPDYAVLSGRSPTGASVLWFNVHSGKIIIYCFIPGAEG